MKNTSVVVDIRKKLKNFSLEVSFSQEEGTFLGMLGESGCGKSMTLRCIAGIETPDEGYISIGDRVLFDSKNRINLSPQERKVGYLFQSYALFPHMSVLDNIRLGAGKHVSESEIRRYMDLVNVADLAKVYPDKLSGGQQQRVALVRMLISNPYLLLLDEPFSALDSYIKERIQLDLIRILKEVDKEAILVSHSRDEVYRMCDKILVIDRGKVVAKGLTENIFNNPMNIASAKLTGCKNILKIQKKGAYHFYIIDWDIEIETQEEVPDDVTHIGIRAHALRPILSKEIHSQSFKNMLECKGGHMIRDPFEVVVVFDKNIWWKVSKQVFFEELDGKMPTFLEICDDSYFYLVN